MKRALGLFLVIALAMAGAGFAAPAAPVTITVLHTNDMHAQGLETATTIGYPRIAGYANDLRGQGKNVLLLDAGDVLHGLPWANLERGKPVVDLMNAAGYDAMTTGNHDYNYGNERLVELSKMMKFPVLAANVYKDGKPLFTPYIIKEIQGVRVAIFGLATPETLYKADPAGLKGVEFRDPVKSARDLVYGELAGKYDVLICLAHLGIDKSTDVTSYLLARFVPAISLIVDGHSHSSLQAEILNNTSTNVLIVSADANGVSLGRVDITVDTNGKVVSRIPQTINVINSPNLPSDPGVKAAVKAIDDAQAPIRAEIVGKSAINLEGTREIVRASESNLGRLIANGMLASTGADIALMNGGGIRTSIKAGDITKSMVYTVLPFGNYLWTVKLTGQEFQAVLENGVSKLPAIDGRYPHLAGASFTFDATKPVGERVTAITVGGAAIDPAKTYTLVTLSFVITGGDGYTMLGNRDHKEFTIDADSFMAYLKALGTVTEDNIPYKK